MPRSSSRAALSGLRATTVMSVTPSSASADDGRRCGAARPEHDRARPDDRARARRRRRRCRCCRRASRAAVRTRVLAEPTSSARCGALVGEPQRGELAGHGHRHADPLGPETADQRRAIRRRCTRCARRSSRRGPARGRRPGAVAVTGNARSASPAPRPCARSAQRALSRTPLRLASSILARCCW